MSHIPSISAKFKYRTYIAKLNKEKQYGPYGPYFYQTKREGESVVSKYLGRSIQEVAESLHISRKEAFYACMAALLKLIENSKDPKVKSRAREFILSVLKQVEY